MSNERYQTKARKLEMEGENYASLMIQTAALYAGRMKLYGKLSKRILQKAPVSEGYAHLDAGCGSGELLLSLAERLKGENVRNFNLIGVDVIRPLLEAAAARAKRIRDLDLITNISSVYEVNTRGKLTQVFVPQPERINRIKPHSRHQLILLQDDLMRPQVLPGALSRLGPTPRLSSMSFTLPGVGENKALEELSEAEDIIDNKDILKVIEALAKLTRRAVYELAAKNLIEGGVLIDVSRSHSWKAKEEYEEDIRSDYYSSVGTNAAYLDLEAMEISEPVDNIERASPLSLRNLNSSTPPKQDIRLVQFVARRNNKTFGQE